MENDKEIVDWILNDNLDWWGDIISDWSERLDNQYAQMVQDLLEMRS
jgi:hypothetical protein